MADVLEVTLLSCTPRRACNSFLSKFPPKNKFWSDKFSEYVKIWYACFVVIKMVSQLHLTHHWGFFCSRSSVLWRIFRWGTMLFSHASNWYAGHYKWINLKKMVHDLQLRCNRNCSLKDSSLNLSTMMNCYGSSHCKHVCRSILFCHFWLYFRSVFLKFCKRISVWGDAHKHYMEKYKMK